MHFLKITALTIGLGCLLVYALADKQHLHKKAKSNLSMILFSGITFIFVALIS